MCVNHKKLLENAGNSIFKPLDFKFFRGSIPPDLPSGPRLQRSRAPHLYFICYGTELTLLNIDTYSNILIESSSNTNEMFSRVNEKRIYVIDITFGINESIFSGNEQQKVYFIILRGPHFLQTAIKRPLKIAEDIRKF